MTDASKATGSTSKAIPPGYAAALEPVRRRFIDMTESRILAIEALRVDILRQVNVDQSVREIARMAHKIAGVAGTLGYAEIGNFARMVEQGLDETGSPLLARDRWIATQHEVENLLDAMEAMLDD